MPPLGSELDLAGTTSHATDQPNRSHLSPTQDYHSPSLLLSRRLLLPLLLLAALPASAGSTTRAGLDTGHHLLLGDEVIDTLEEAEQALHVGGPLVQDIVDVAGLGKRHDAGGAVDARVHRLGAHQLADVLLRLVLRQVEELRQPPHADARVVLGDDAHVVLDHALAQVLPPLVRLALVVGLVRLAVEHVRAAQVGAELLRHLGPAHQLVHREELQQLRVVGDLGVSRVSEDTVEEIVLFVVVWGEDDEIDDALKDLK